MINSARLEVQRALVQLSGKRLSEFGFPEPTAELRAAGFNPLVAEQLRYDVAQQQRRRAVARGRQDRGGSQARRG